MCENCGCGNHDHDHTHVVLPVGGMSCGHCAKQIEDGLRKLSGVEEARADFNEGTVSLVLAAGGDLAEVKQVIEDLGFDV